MGGSSRASTVQIDPDRVLTPYERCVEVVTGLIITLSVVGSVSVISNNPAGRTALLVAILGCNVAWGVVDAALYLISQRLARARTALVISAVAGSTAEDGRTLLGRVLPEPLAAVLTPDDLETLRGKIAGLRPQDSTLSGRDWRGAAGVFLDVVLGSVPVALPFALPLGARQAVHVSFAVALLMLLALGLVMGRFAGINPWRSAGVLVALGAALVAVVILLGG
jgi:hypothetical protein